MMKSLRLHRQQRRQEVVVPPARAASASTDTKLTTAIGILASKGTDPSKSSSASLSTEGSSSIQSSSHDGDGLVDEPLLLGKVATATARQTVGGHAGGPASKQQQQGSRNDECAAGQRVRAFPRGCLRVRTQHESLQQKYGRWNVGIDNSSVPTREAADRSAVNSTTTTSAVADAGSTEYFEAASHVRSVKFTDITVYSHQWILGDNPSVTSGPPICIEWNAFATSTIALDDYENSRQQPPRHHSELQVPGGLRAAWMLRAGFTPEEIATVEKQVRIVQLRRSANLPRNPNPCVSSSPYNPCGKYNAQIKKGMAKLWTRPKRAGRKTSDEDDESEAVIYVDAP